jgi:hypothetical protein
MHLRIAHLYPELLNLYGDRGNLITLQRRCEWRGIECSVQPVSLNQPFAASEYDLVFIGGGQDYEQNLLHEDLLVRKGPAIRAAVEDGLVFLCICGGYQLMGHEYVEHDGRRIVCLGAIDVRTEAQSKRMIGDTIYHSDFLAEKGLSPQLVGFENHSGRTWLGPTVRPLARVIKGGGNNGEDGTEGAIYRNVYCTYSHGSFLPKNPSMADWLIYLALKRQNEVDWPLSDIDDTLSENARKHLLTCK